MAVEAARDALKAAPAGTVEALFYTSPTFSAGRLRVDAEQAVSFAGALMVRAPS